LKAAKREGLRTLFATSFSGDGPEADDENSAIALQQGYITKTYQSNLM
jgi:hypothetical protein